MTQMYADEKQKLFMRYFAVFTTKQRRTFLLGKRVIPRVNKSTCIIGLICIP